MTTSWNGRITQAKRADKKNFVIVWDGQNYDVDFWVWSRARPTRKRR